MAVLARRTTILCGDAAFAAYLLPVDLFIRLSSYETHKVSPRSSLEFRIPIERSTLEICSSHGDANMPWILRLKLHDDLRNTHYCGVMGFSLVDQRSCALETEPLTAMVS